MSWGFERRIMLNVKNNFLRKLPKDAHKYSHGTVAVLAGSPNYSGAALLCVGGRVAVDPVTSILFTKMN